MSSFFRESFMERSDGSVIPVCTSCGTIPIYNPRIGLAYCPLCAGPTKFIGDRPSNLELLPPLGRQKGKIVNVEMPFATTVLAKELETYMNIGMRFITTGDTAKLRQLELSGEATEVFKELPKITYPSFTVPEVASAPEQTTVTAEQLQAFQRDVSALRQAQINLPDDEDELDDMPPLEPAEGVAFAEGTGEMAQLQSQPVALPLVQQQPQVQFAPQPQQLLPQQQVQFAPQPPMMQEGQQVQFGQPQQQLQQQEGGTRDMIMSSPLPNGPKMIVVDTSYSAMSGEGLVNPNMGMTRSVGGFGRQRPLRQSNVMMGGAPQPQTGLVPGRTDGDTVLKSSTPVFVNKLG
jgi:hypothetical protein